MQRLLLWPSLTVFLLGVLVLPACGQQDTADAVSASCTGNIPREKIDACLERARVIDETDPSAPLQALEAQLEQQARHPDAAQSGPPPDAASNQEPPRNYGPDDKMAHDQGAVPDEQPAPGEAANDQLPPPEGPRGDLSPPVDQTGPGDLTPPDDGPQGPPPDNTPPSDNADPQGQNR